MFIRSLRARLVAKWSRSLALLAMPLVGALIFSSAQAQTIVYSPAVLTSASNTSLFVQIQAVNFSGGKWTYKVSWNRTLDRTGSIYISPKVDRNQVVGSNINGNSIGKTGEMTLQLSPATRYRLEFYTQPNSAGKLFLRKFFNTLDSNGNAIATEQIPASNGGTLGTSSGGGTNPTPTPTTTTGGGGTTTTGNVAACISALGGKTFAPQPGVSPYFNVNSRAQEIKNYDRCHYDSTYGNFVINGNIVSNPSLTAQRQAAADCAQKFETQAGQVGLQGSCTIAEYCGSGSSGLTPVNRDGSGGCTANQKYQGREVLCSLSKNGVTLTAGQADAVVGNDYGMSHAQAEPQRWFNWLWVFNAEIANKNLSYQHWEAWYDAGRNVFRGPNTSANGAMKLPAACTGVMNVTAVANSETQAQVSWTAPAGVSSVSIYLIGDPSIGVVAGHEDQLRVESTVAENIASKTGSNTYTFNIPLENQLPVPGQVSRASWLYGWFSGTGKIDDAVQKELLKTAFFVRIVANNGVVADSNRFGINGQVDPTNSSFYKGNNPPGDYVGSLTCEQRLGQMDMSLVPNDKCYDNLLSSHSYQIGIYGSNTWYPMCATGAGMVVRVAAAGPNDQGRAQVMGGCGGGTDSTNSDGTKCVVKDDDVWHNFTGQYAGGGVPEGNGGAVGNYIVENLKPATKYWFRVASVCNAGQASQAFKDQVWSCTTKPATGSCTNQCNPGGSGVPAQTKCLGGGAKVRVTCGYYDNTGCATWPGQGQAGSYVEDSSCN